MKTILLCFQFIKQYPSVNVVACCYLQQNEAELIRRGKRR